MNWRYSEFRTEALLMTAGSIARDGMSEGAAETEGDLSEAYIVCVYHVAVDIASFVRSSTAPRNEERWCG